MRMVGIARPHPRQFLEAAGCKMRFAGDQAVPYFEDPFGFVFDIIERPAKITA